MYLPAIPIETEKLCHHGCGQTAKFTNKSGKLLCAEFSNKCPSVRNKNSNGLKSLYARGLKDLSHFDGKRNWSKGLTKETDDRVAKQANSVRGRRKIADVDRLKKVLYKEQCQFSLSGIEHKIDGYELLQKHGMYHKKTNPGGVVRDHIISVEFGFKNNVDPKIISHPTNCRFIHHKDNARKTHQCGLTLEELMCKIQLWDREGNWYTLLVESQ